MFSRVVLVASAVATAVLAGAAQAPSAQKQEPEPQRPVFRTEANFIRVDVFPTKGGAPVRDLRRAEFELLEDGVPQKIETFEFVHVRAGVGGQDHRREPNTIAESREALKNPRARVFVLFLDVPHVTADGAWNVRAPLVRLIDRVLGDEDLVGIMTPRMAASDIVFARKTEVIAGGLQDRWPWGERFTIQEDERDYLYKACYPWDETEGVVAEMKARRRERMSLDALFELVSWLREQREERKAILTISEGWQLFTENRDLTRPRVIDPATGATEPIPGPEPIGVGRDGRLRVGVDELNRPGTRTQCDRDRLTLSLLDHRRFFRDILDEANRANASFYSVDPRGLPVFDAPMGPDAPPPPSVDQQNLRNRIETLQMLAENTDGIAVVNSNDIEKGLRRMADDLTSYYLLGYYSTNTKLDGRFRQIKVRVNRPGVDIRARRGYRAATREEMRSARAAAAAPMSESMAAARAALAPLASVRGDAPLRTRAVARKGHDVVWVSGELARPGDERSTLDISVTSGGASRTSSFTIAAGQRSFLHGVRLNAAVTGATEVRVRIASNTGAVRAGDTVRVEPTDGIPEPMMFHRGPVTGNRLMPLADPVFSRTTRARFEVPLLEGVTIESARLLDRNGEPLQLPVTLGERTDEAGRWATADIVLAPLGAGEYVLELAGTANGEQQKMMTGLRITR